MHDKVMGAGDADEGFVTTDVKDARDRAEVLREVLFSYPESYTYDELVRELTVDSAEFREPTESGEPSAT